MVNPEQVAERLIGEAAQLMKGTFRGGDILIRYSRDKFLVLMPDTNRRQAERATVRLRDVADQWNLGNAQLEMVLNCGAAEYRTGASLDSMLLRAEQRIAARSAGENESSQQRPSSSLEEHSTAARKMRPSRAWRSCVKERERHRRPHRERAPRVT